MWKSGFGHVQHIYFPCGPYGTVPEGRLGTNSLGTDDSEQMLGLTCRLINPEKNKHIHKHTACIHKRCTTLQHSLTGNEVRVGGWPVCLPLPYVRRVNRISTKKTDNPKAHKKKRQSVHILRLLTLRIITMGE